MLNDETIDMAELWRTNPDKAAEIEKHGTPAGRRLEETPIEEMSLQVYKDTRIPNQTSRSIIPLTEGYSGKMRINLDTFNIEEGTGRSD